MAQGLTQAIASFLSPTQMGTQFSELQKKLLAKPSKYIDSYQVFSESQTDGMFQVIGQVTVSMDALKKELEESGILAAQQKPPAPPASSPALSAPAAATEGENKQDEEDAEPSVETDDSQPPVEEASQPPVIEPGASRPASRGIAATRREILWVVPEKWEQEWEIPTDGSDVRSFFARSLGKEMEDLEFSILLPQPGSVRMDLSGNIPSSQVISLAEGLGIQDVVVGKVSYMQDRNSKQAWLDASLRVIRIGQGKSEFELHKTQSIEDISNQEGALELAAQVAPQLSSLLGGSQAGGAQRGGAGASGPGQEASSSQPGSVGPLTDLSALRSVFILERVGRHSPRAVQKYADHQPGDRVHSRRREARWRQWGLHIENERDCASERCDGPDRILFNRDADHESIVCSSRKCPG